MDEVTLLRIQEFKDRYYALTEEQRHGEEGFQLFNGFFPTMIGLVVQVSQTMSKRITALEVRMDEYETNQAQLRSSTGL